MSPIEKRELQDLYQRSKALTQDVRRVLRAVGMDDRVGVLSDAVTITRAFERLCVSDMRYRAAWAVFVTPAALDAQPDDRQASESGKPAAEQRRRDAPGGGADARPPGLKLDHADGQAGGRRVHEGDLTAAHERELEAEHLRGQPD